MQPILHTQRLTLRPFRFDDVPDVHRMAGDPRIADTTIAMPHPYPEGAAKHGFLLMQLRMMLQRK